MKKHNSVNPAFRYDNPFTAVFLRKLAWEKLVAKRHPVSMDVVKNEMAQHARAELGLEKVSYGPIDEWISKARKMGLVTKKGKTFEVAEEGWGDQWRLLYLPRHAELRQLSIDPVYEVMANQEVTISKASEKVVHHVRVTLRDAALPTMNLFIGTGHPPTDAIEKRRGLELLFCENGLYIGQSSNFEERMRDHRRKKSPTWWIFAVPQLLANFHESKQTYDALVRLDTLFAWESLTYSLWSEVARVLTKRTGISEPIEYRYLQEAILLTKAISSSIIWLLRELPELPFDPPLKINRNESMKQIMKKAKYAGWPNCYFDKDC